MLQALRRWLFSDDSAPAPPLPAPVTTTPDLEARLARLESQMTGISLSWAETLDKLQRWTNRQSARDAGKVHKALDVMNSAEEAAGATISPQPTTDPHALKMELRRRLRAQGGQS